MTIKTLAEIASIDVKLAAKIMSILPDAGLRKIGCEILDDLKAQEEYF